jgi:F420H(2)-dependent quinone reductase
MNDWKAQVIAEFRANGGKVAQFGDAPLVILHTIGAKSGGLREIPLVALVEGETLTVFASTSNQANRLHGRSEHEKRGDAASTSRPLHSHESRRSATRRAGVTRTDHPHCH